jgi:hypothetical protein
MNSGEKNKALLEKLSRPLFWDVDRKTIDYKKHSVYITDRVLAMGTMEDFQILKAIYSKPKLKEMVCQIRYMDERVLHFCSAYFNIPVTKFRCYITKRSNQAHWNY